MNQNEAQAAGMANNSGLKMMTVPENVHRGLLAKIKDLETQLEEYRTFTGERHDDECVECHRRPIFGMQQTVGQPGKAVCKDCLDTKEIVGLKDRVAKLEDARMTVELMLTSPIPVVVAIAERYRVAAIQTQHGLIKHVVKNPIPEVDNGTLCTWPDTVERITEQHNGIFSVELFFGHDGHRSCKFKSYDRLLSVGESDRSMQLAVGRCIEIWRERKNDGR